MSDLIQISRDPFSRHDVVRELVRCAHGCAWCGQPRRSGKLFRYGVWADSARGIAWQRRLYCSVGCMRSYEGG